MVRGRLLLIAAYISLFTLWLVQSLRGRVTSNIVYLGVCMPVFAIVNSLFALHYLYSNKLARKIDGVVLYIFGLVCFGIGFLLFYLVGTSGVQIAALVFLYFLYFLFSVCGFVYLSDKKCGTVQTVTKSFVFSVLIAAIAIVISRYVGERYLTVCVPLESFSLVLLSVLLLVRKHTFRRSMTWYDAIFFGHILRLVADILFVYGLVVSGSLLLWCSGLLYLTSVFFVLLGIFGSFDADRPILFGDGPTYFRKMTYFVPFGLNCSAVR